MNSRKDAIWMVLVRYAFNAVLLEGVGLALSTDYFASPSGLKLHAANSYCNNLNGSLILLNNQDEWTDICACIRESGHTLHWTGLRLNSSYPCQNDNTWSYNGWAKWENGGNEPNNCPDKACVVVGCNGMRTKRCNKNYPAFCRKDATTSTQITTIGTADTKTTTQHTYAAEATAVDPTMSENVESSSFSTCRECCFKGNKSRQVSHEELNRAIQELKSQLAVNKTNLSGNRRKLVSVYDSRPSSVAMGGVAVAILVVAISIIVVPDMVNLSRFLYKKTRGAKHAQTRGRQTNI